MSDLTDVHQKLVDGIMNLDLTTEDPADLVKSLKTVVEAQKLAEPDPIPDPEPTGVRAFFSRNSGDLIKVAGTLSVVTIIAAIEAKGDIIFRSKASKFL